MEISLRLIIVLVMFSLSFVSNAQSDEEFLNSIKEKVNSSPQQVIPLINKKLSTPTLSTEMKLSLQIELAKAFYSLGHYKKSSDVFIKVKMKAIRQGFDYIEADSVSGIASIFFELGDYESALFNYQQAHIMYESIGNQLGLGESLRGISGSYTQLGNFESSLEYSIRALKVFQNINNKPNLADLNNNIGAIHFYLKNYTKAIQYYQQAIEIANEIGILDRLSSFYFNKGEAYIEIEKYHLAEGALNQALKFSVYAKGEISFIYTYFGKLYLAQGLLEKALVEFNKALVLATSQGQRNLEVEILQGKARVFLAQDKNLALVLANEALKKAKKLDRPSLVRDSHELLYKIYAKQQNFEQAFKHSELYHQIDNQIIDKDQQTKLVKLSSSIEIEQKQYKIELLKKDSALQSQLMKAEKIQRNLLLGGTIAFLLLLFAFYRRLHHKKQSIYLKLQVEARTKHIKTLSEIGREITSSLEISHIAKIVYEHIKELFDADAFSIGIYKKEHQRLEFPVTIEKNKHLDSFYISMTESDRPAVQCISHRCEVLIGQQPLDGDKHSPNYKISIGSEMRSATYIPLLIESNIIGCITIQRQDEGGFSDYQLDMMRTISAYTAIAIDNALTHEALKEASNTDFLTSLPNRRSFIEKAKYQLDICQRNQSPLSFAIADIDKFKLFNDTYGHDGGDFVLKEVSNLFKCALRKQDLVARWGGEEFVFMLPNTNLKDAEKLLEKIRLKLENAHFELNSQNFTVTSTFGLIQVSNIFNIEELIDIADSALYDGKNSGRNKVVTKSGTTAQTSL